MGSRRVGVAPVSRARAVCVMVCVEQTCSTHDPTTQRFDDSTTYISHKRTVHRAATTARAPPPRPVAPVVPFMRHEHLEINVPRFNLNKLIKIRITTRSGAVRQETSGSHASKVPRAPVRGAARTARTCGNAGLTRVGPARAGTRRVRVPARPASSDLRDCRRRIRVSGGRIADPGRCPSLPAENPPRPSRPAPCLPGRGGPVYFSPIA